MAASAEAAGPTNHIYLSFHGMPTYTWTVRLYDKSDKEVTKASQTCVGGCKRTFSYNPDSIGSAYISIDSGRYWGKYRFYSTTGVDHDHCILVKAGGQISYTGNETQGCNGR